MTGSDIPKFTEHEKRALIYIHETQNSLKQDEPPTISQLVDHTGWESKYFTRAWKKLEPRSLVERRSDGKYTRLSTTVKGGKIVDLLLEINEVLDN